MKKRSKHSLSHYHLKTFNQGELVPVSCMEVLPGDTFQHATTALIRTNPLLAPVMHPVHARIQHWFVPLRLIWEDWEEFITGGPDGLNASVHPTITFGGGSGAAVGSLACHFGIPTGVNNIEVSALPFRAYALIYNEGYRNPDLQTELTIDLTDGADSTTNTTLQNCNWEKDRFTGARTSTQKGSEVTLPLGTEAPVLGIGKGTQANSAASAFYEGQGGSTNTDTYSRNTSAESFYMGLDSSGYPNIRADLSNATAATINQLREAFGLQTFAENMMRYGSRYTEYVRSLGVFPEDSRLQRPELLGSGKQTLQFSEVLQTGVDSTDAGVGNLKGHGIGAMKSNRYRRFFPEHGLIISLMYVRPRTIYNQGLSKMWFRETKEDYFQKELQHIGMQAIQNREVYAAHTTPEGTFGYADQYDEYRSVPSFASGEFRIGAGLEHFHMVRNFSSDPALNSTFVEANPTDRIYASTSSDQLQVFAWNSVQARRLLHKSGTPIGL